MTPTDWALAPYGLPILFFALTVLLLTTALQYLLHRIGLRWMLWCSGRRAIQRYHVPKGAYPGTAAIWKADQIAAQLFTPAEYVQWLNPQRTLNTLMHSNPRQREEIIDNLMACAHPTFWTALPESLKKHIYSHGSHYLRPFLDDVLDDVIEQADVLFDFHQTVCDYAQREHFDATRTMLKCLMESELINTHQRSQRLHRITVFSLPLIITISLGYFGLTHHLTTISSPAYFSLAMAIALITIIGAQWINTPTSLLPSSKECPQDRTDHSAQKPKHTRTVSAHRQKITPLLCSSLAQHLMNPKMHLYSLTVGTKKHALKKIIMHRFQQWFIRTLPGHDLIRRFTDEDTLNHLCHVVSNQFIQEIQHFFEQPEYRSHCETDIEQRVLQRLLSLSEVQFNAVLNTQRVLFIQGWQLALSFMTLTTVMVLLFVW